jgi:peptidoglycan/LPS O-acetylase OafA/YrhL
MQPETVAAEKSRFYLPELDGLRFFAFLAVFLSHVAAFSNGANEAKPAIIQIFNLMGRFGVDLFFALSAYLLTVLMIREKDKFGSLDVRAFYMRRLLRIWPLYFTWIAALMLTRHFWSNYSIGFFVPWLLFAGNFQASLLAINTINSLVILPLWSLSVEEQFYLIWPLLVRNLTRRGLIVAGTVIWILTTCARFELIRHGFTPHQIWFTGFARLGSMAAGILLAALMRRPLHWDRRIFFVFGLLCWAEAAGCHLLLSHPEGYLAPMWGFSIAAVGSVALLVAAIGVKRGNLLTSRPVVYLGRISYGLYIFHGAALVAASHIVPASSNAVFWPLLVIVAFSLTLAASAASYRWLESGFLRRKRRYEVIRSGPVFNKTIAA